MIKELLKTKKILSLIVIIFFLTNFSFFIANNVSAISFTPQVTIDNNIEKGKAITIGSDSIGKYILSIYNYAIGSVGILATVVLMYAGILWITAAGNQEQIGKAKGYIASSLTGLVLALCSWMILYTVNPDLITMKPIAPVPVKTHIDTLNNNGCCQYDNACIINSQSSCNYSDEFVQPGIWKGSGYICSNNLCKTCYYDNICSGGIIVNEGNCANKIATGGNTKCCCR